MEMSSGSTNWEEVKALQKRIAELWHQEEIFWHQRSPVKWLQEGDKNSRFFYATTLQRRDRNRVQRIKGQNGQLVEGQKEVEHMILDYYKAIYTSEPAQNVDECLSAVPRLVTRAINDELMKPVLEADIKSAVDSLGALKAPGPDGFNGIFYQNHWNIVKGEVSRAVQDFFHGGELPRDINETVVTLIPKVPMLESINQLRPISCCNFSCKIISKIVVLRLKKYMDSLISPNQSAFVGGRLIQDNLLVAFIPSKERIEVERTVWQ